MFTVVLAPIGGTSLELTPIADSVRFTTAAVGGFGSCSFAVAGNRTRDLPYRAEVRVFHGSFQVWEGELEDRSFSVERTTVTAFGWQRRFQRQSVRYAWVKRQLDFQLATAGTTWPALGTPTFSVNEGDVDVTIGEIDAGDVTKRGVRARGNGGSIGANAGGGAYARVPFVPELISCYLRCTVTPGGSWQALMAAPGGDVDYGALITLFNWGDPSLAGFIPNSANNPVFSQILSDTLAVFGVNHSGFTASPSSSDYIDFTDIRLGAFTESATGGMYGGDVLRNLLTSTASRLGLTAGDIEQGSDFLIEELERSVRDTVLSVVDELAGYYTREWAVWEGKRLDWKSVNYDEAQWVIPQDDCIEVDIRGSLDGLVETAYVLYTDAASGLQQEASATSTDSRNPFTKDSVTSDGIFNAGVPMTENTAQQLATQIAAAQGTYPRASGRVVISASRLVRNFIGSPMPAACIRAGTNLSIPDLPKTEPFRAGRDGETLFHIVSTEVDMEAGTVSLELEGQSREIDVITARLAAVTRTITG